MKRLITYVFLFLCYMYLVTLPLAFMKDDFIGPFMMATFFVVNFVLVPCFILCKFVDGRRVYFRLGGRND